MPIVQVDATRRRKWRDVGDGMLIMLSVFGLVDGIGRILHGRDMGWFMASVWTLALIINVYRTVRD